MDIKKQDEYCEACNEGIQYGMCEEKNELRRRAGMVTSPDDIPRPAPSEDEKP
jgi:hypothetical protein